MRIAKKKICLLGDFSVGKTSLIRRYVEGSFDEKYLSTIGVNISRKTLSRDSYQLDFIIWDLAGGEEFSAVNANYLRGSAGGILVCDLTRPETLTTVPGYAQLAREVNPRIALLIAANKSDLVEERTITTQNMDALAAELDMPWRITSAKSGDQVLETFHSLATAIESVAKAANSEK